MAILALKQPVVADNTGTPHPDAVYIPADIHMAPIVSEGNVGWRCYHDQTALLTGKEPLSSCDVAIHINPEDNAKVCAFTPNSASTTYAAQTWEALIFVTKTVRDTDRGQKDTSGKTILEPFFNNATVIAIG